MAELLPRRTVFVPDQPVEVEVRTSEPTSGLLIVEHLTRLVVERQLHLPAGRHVIDLGTLPRGGYAVTLITSTAETSTALDVLDHPFERPRYGFLSDFTADRADIDATMDDLRRLHLDVIQFYDWMYRHDDLLGDEEDFEDALGRRLSHRTTRALIEAVHGLGSVAMAYAAVYGVSKRYASEHPEQLLYHHDDTPWTLGDFLTLADPTAERPWTAHLQSELRAAVTQMGFTGFHLDQYGWPKLALRHDESLVDLAEAFAGQISAIRAGLPDTRLIFNNVNNFPTATMATTPQDAVYIEVWPPHDTYNDLAELISNARLLASDKPVILAAYLEAFAEGPDERAEAGLQLVLATILANGGHHLLCGERHGLLVDPYYPNYRSLSETSFDLVRRYLDAAVALGDLLYDDGPVVTRSWHNGINEEIRIDAPVAVSGSAEAGKLWTLVRRGENRLTIHLIDLSTQQDIRWNTGKNPIRPCHDVTLHVSLPIEPTAVAFTAPATDCRARPLPFDREGDHLQISLPEFNGWASTTITFV